MSSSLTFISLSIFIIICIYFSSWLSSTETAITNLSNRQLAILRQKKDKHFHYLLQLKKRFSRTLITLLIANNVVNILLSSITALIANRIFHSIGVSITIGTVTFMLILFGEIVPKSRAILESVQISQKRARTLFYLTKILLPLVLIFRWLSKLILRFTGVTELHQMPLISEDSIMSMTSMAESEGIIKPIERKIIEHVFTFGDKKIRDVMKPMQNVFTLNQDNTMVEVQNTIYQKGYSRIPVIDKDKMIQGILYAKDLSCPNRSMPVKKLMKKPFFSHIDQEITVLFEEMRLNHNHLSVVIDHEKKHVGIITMEDILEELVGEIEDEYDNPSQYIKKGENDEYP